MATTSDEAFRLLSSLKAEAQKVAAAGGRHAKAMYRYDTNVTQM
jgi:hypothetical protein